MTFGAIRTLPAFPRRAPPVQQWVRMKMPGNMQNMMAQAQKMQQKMQEEIALIRVEGSAGGGMVTVKLTAKGDLKAAKIDDSLLKPSEKDIVEDLLVAAHADARRKAEAVMQDKMKALTGGLPLPPGMNLT